MQQSPHFPEAFYRVSVRGVYREDDKFLLGRHAKAEIWETFGGGLDFGEELHEALRREIMEETGCEVSYISEQPLMALPHIVHGKRKMEWFYNFPIYFDVKFDLSQFDTSLQYAEYAWFTFDEIQQLNVFEGEEGIKEGFRALLSES